MKKFYMFFTLAVLFVSVNNLIVAQVPTYNLRAMNFTFASINHPIDAIEFDVYMEHTNPPVELQYAGGQYFFEFNSGIIPGNFRDTNVATYRIIGSDLPAGMRPRNPQMAIEQNPPASSLRLAANSLPGPGNGFIFPNNGFPGTKIVRMRILCKTGSLNPVPLNLLWRNVPSIPGTKINAYIGTANTEITTPSTHIIDDSSATNPISLISPAYNSSTALRAINFSWHKDTAITTYKLLVSRNINFNDIAFLDSTLTDTFKTLSNLSPNAIYYWRVFGKNDSQYVTASDVWFFSINGVEFLLNSPEQDAREVPLPVNFSWYKAGSLTSFKPRNITYENFDNIDNETIILDTFKTHFEFSSTTTYKLEVATFSDFNNIVFIDSTITDTSRIVSSLLLNKIYYWRVTPKNDSIFYNVSEIRKFNTIPAPVLLANPANAAQQVQLPVSFMWFERNNALSYKLQVSTNQSFNNIIFSDSAITDTFKTVSGLSQDTRYYWRVSAKNDSQYFSFSPVWNFTTYGILISPPNGSQFIPTTINFEWHKIDSAVNYVLQVSTSPLFNSFVVNDSTLTDTFKTVSGFDNSTEYYWRIKVKYASNNFFMSNVWYFNTADSGIIYTIDITIQGVQEVPPNLSPAVGALQGTYNAASGVLEFDVVFTGLVGPSTTAALHGPALPGFNAPVQIAFSGFPAGVFAGSYSNSYILTSQQATQILGGQWYVNIKSLAFPDGEIRGQLDQGTLPVELSAFTSNVFKDNVTLKWTTTNEINNSGFDIERSIVDESIVNGEWSIVGNVVGNGNSNEIKNYSFSERLSSGKYKYRLKQIDFNGNFEYFNLSNEVEVGIPNRYTLSQNYPNPFNPTTQINFELAADGKVSLVLYDISGREVANLINEFKTAGYYTVNVNASNLSSGIYFYTISAKDFRMTKKMMVVK